MSQSMESLLSIMSLLRDPEKGCPWDRKQSFETIIPHTIEETFEVVDAIHNKDWVNLKEELGDLLFQVVFYSQLAKEKQLFHFDDVINSLNEKLKRRHPHVFSNKKFTSDEELNANWEQEKAKEKAKLGKVDVSILDCLPTSLPALSKANKIQQCCAKHGFDWDTIDPVAGKVREELDEVLDEVFQTTPNENAIEEELGDLLFATVNLVRHLGKDPEVALRKANNKFEKRFKGVECLVREKGKQLDDFSLDQLDAMWDTVKKRG